MHGCCNDILAYIYVKKAKQWISVKKHGSVDNNLKYMI